MVQFTAGQIFAVLATVGSLAIEASAQCLRSSGYLTAHDAFSGARIGAVSRVAVSARGAHVLDVNNTASNWLRVEDWSADCSATNPFFLKQISAPNSQVGYVSLVIAQTDCSSAYLGDAGVWTYLAPADGFPHGQYTTPGVTRTTVNTSGSGGSYSVTDVLCGENMTFDLQNSDFRPTWKNPNGSRLTSLVVLQDLTDNSVVVAPNANIYSSATGHAVRQIVLTIDN